MRTNAVRVKRSHNAEQTTNYLPIAEIGYSWHGKVTSENKNMERANPNTAKERSEITPTTRHISERLI